VNLDIFDVLMDNLCMTDIKSADETANRIIGWLDTCPIEAGSLLLDFTTMPKIDLAGFRILIARCAEWKECGLKFKFKFKGELSSKIDESNTKAIPGYLSQETGTSLQNILELYCSSPDKPR